MSWINILLGKITIHQAKVLHQFLVLSESGDRHVKLSAEGFGWVSIEWIGWWNDTESATHCRVQADCEDICDSVLPVPQVKVLISELASELSRAFDKPEQSPFRQDGRS